jgi:hypothetical protein
MGVSVASSEVCASLPGRLTQAVREDDLAGLALLPEGRTATGPHACWSRRRTCCE